MRALVTGGAGFIGSHVARHLVAAGHDVVVLDAFTYAGHRSTLADVAGDVRIVEGDIADRAVVAAVMPEVEVVFHLAAESHVDRSLTDPDAFVRTNCLGTNVLCDEARRAGVNRFVHVSTDEVYGSIVDGAFDEEAPLCPSSPYSSSKASSDLIALSYATSFGLDVVVTRCTNNLGPFQMPEKLVPLAVTRLLAGQTIGLYGDGRHQRDWLHVDDHVRALLLVAEQGVAGTVYNVGADHHCTNRSLLERVCTALNVSTDRIVPVADRPGHDRRYAVVSDRVRALGWSPTRSLDDTIDATVQWYADNRAWWEPIVAADR
jgi:dTDP-glucose 4,6-dehydratase